MLLAGESSGRSGFPDVLIGPTAPLGRRNVHESTVLTLLRDRGPLSRVRLSEITGLSPTTITKAVAPLIRQGLLREQVDASGKVGRPSIALIPVPERVSMCAVQIGVGTFRVGIADALCRVRELASHDFDPSLPMQDVMEMIADTAEALMRTGDGASCIGVGVGAPGPVDVGLRRVRLSINLKWTDVPVADILESRLGLPVVVDHNVRSMALAEFRYGGHGVDSLAYLYVKTGVGLGAAVRGRPFYGGSGGESYLGHTRAVENGLQCACGARGCLDTLVSEPYLLSALSAVTDRRKHAGIRRDVLGVLESEARRGNGGAQELRLSFLHHLATALEMVTNLFTPDLVLVGGILSNAPEAIISDLAQRTRERIFPLLRDDFRLERADGTDAAVVKGAAAVALEALHYG